MFKCCLQRGVDLNRENTMRLRVTLRRHETDMGSLQTLKGLARRPVSLRDKKVLVIKVKTIIASNCFRETFGDERITVCFMENVYLNYFA